jgi:hypothetical protein
MEHARGRRNGVGIAALAVGLVSLVVAGLILGTVAIVLGTIGINRANRGQATNKWMAMVGVGLGIAGVVSWFIFLVILQ